MATFVLIHGAWHGGWCWRKVVPLLESRGHTVVAPDLPSHGDDPASPVTVTLASYAERICEVVAAQKEPVILLAHSMAGVVITQAAEICAERVRALVYLTAFLPRNGESLMTWSEQDPGSLLNGNIVRAMDGAVNFRPEAAHAAFYANCTAEDEAFAVSRLMPQGVGPFADTVTTTPERWGGIPRYYIECVRDRAINLPLQQAMHSASPCRKVFSIDTDHSPFFSAPEELVRILLEIEEDSELGS
ncbi:alpha/beta fold hydrolase [Occallatibacter riparius]|uniref:Alpha/beta fold hydrolase n=1 Tax=Occallatibacter riparius TaxID=1002689 RepID=A0A9J7BIF0_9BACT|nr:alpha/beta fold hydrolase [Occallatibacter riparius]UWZ82259.1 alpha/beta fold hydrolase [Occallatibacter riparius]